MFRIVRYLIACVLLLAVATDGVAKRKKATPASAVPQLSVSDQRRVTYFFAEGKRAALAGNGSAAMDLFAHCLQINPNSPEALYEMALCNFTLRRDSIGMVQLRRASELNPADTHYLETLASCYLALGEYDQATSTLEKMQALQSSRTDVLGQLFMLYKNAGETQKAIDALDRIETLEGITQSSATQKFALYIDQELEKEAFEALQHLCDENPHDNGCRLLMANAYLQQEHPDEALKILQQVARVEPENDDLHLSMLGYYEATGQHERFSHLADSLIMAERTSDELRCQLLTDKIREAAKDSMQVAVLKDCFDALLNRTTVTTKQLATYMVFQGYCLGLTEEELLPTMWRILDLEPDNEPVLRQLIQTYLQHADYQMVEKLCKQASQYNSGELTFHYFLAVSLYQQDRLPETADALQTGLRHVEGEEDAELISDFYGLLGDVYHQMGQEANAFAAYDSCLVYKDDNVSCLNNYAYYLSLREEQLDKAEKMSYRTIRMEPGNKTYLDTYAWILFIQRDYTMARKYIDRVVNPDASDDALLADEELSAVELEHAGDIYSQCGMMEVALRYWNLSLRRDASNQKVSQKIKQKKYIK